MLIRPKLEYAAAVWDPHKIDLIKSIEKIQRRVARFTMNQHRNTSSVGDMLSILQWNSLEKRFQDIRICIL